MTPRVGWYIITKIREMAVGVAIIGRMDKVRTSPFPQNSRLNSTAIETPRLVSIVTAITVK
ncbi:MAG: hypothetical protein H6Q85_2869 [candidate division NC10 bacterium]|nr:hypothetical protein [candidate division NC10 bacterium]